MIPRSGDLQAFDLRDGTLRWTRSTAAPCRHLAQAAGRIISGCGDKLLAFAATDGAETIIDAGPRALDPVVSGRRIVSPHSDGRLNVYDAADGHLTASDVPPELARAYHRNVLADPFGDGACVLGLTGTTYAAACYDAALKRKWVTSLPATRGAAAFDLRQLGPRALVLDDQSSPAGRLTKPSAGRGMVIAWRDGRTSPFTDGTFATVEDRAGKPLRPAPDPFTGAHAFPLSGDAHPLRAAQVVDDDGRAFALIRNGASALAGVDRATGRTLFLVPVALGVLWRLELADGMPVVRTRFADRWTLTVHDPRTGAVLYRDSRPLAPR